MLQSPLGMVKFEAANTIVTLTSSAAVIKAAGTAYIQLITTESDNNVKLIALDHFDKLRERHGGILDDLAVDLLKVLSNSGIEVKNKCLKIVMVLTSQRNVNEVIGILKKELKDTMNSESEIAGEYRGLLVQTIHSCAASFPEIAEQVVKLFLGVISEFSTASAADAIAFMSEVTEKFPALRGELIKDLLSTLPEIKGSKALRMALWVLGEYSEDLETVMASWKCIMDEIGELPLLAQEMREQQGDMPDGGQDEYGERQTGSSSRRVLADGSYATESVLDTKASKTSTMLVKHNIRQLLLEGDYFVGVVLASVLTKLTLRLAKLNPQDTQLNSLVAQAMLVMVGVVRVGQSTFVPAPIDEDSYDRVLSCIKALEFMDDDYEDLQLAFLEESHDAFAKLIKAREEREMQTKEVSTKQVDTDISSPIEFRLLAPKGPANDVEDVDLVASELPENALGGSVTKLDNIVQLTGFSDPVYVETYLTVHQYDIVLDMLVVNQTNDTLRNVTIEFSMLGDLKLVEKPRSYNLAPRSFSSVKAVIKVSSTETGVIFGDLVYDGPSTSESHCIVFNDLHIDILEYIRPAFCDEAKFFSMWSEFEWENKINVLTNICDLRQYLDLLIKSTNMACLTPQSNLCDDIENDCGFLAANLYARSIFGEDSLMNVSLEKVGPTSPVTGHIRIRSKTQGIALSLGDKISQAQKLTLTKSHSQANPPAQTPATPSFSSPLLA
ncbi:Coatomer subunit beta [Zancudomyces culisetae]|uniref:Coatomer subunit beta n=1 Tax=Zancudomyces culisetae TaxID=1213189 RepID=A0A1R1PN87_ZANCU|nr:Coatomer subunit beta [Zancudomyces culisetae]|eukprot:OMH82435.1 Coatomer subunit beta [Zancudomyces culisetae]